MNDSNKYRCISFFQDLDESVLDLNQYLSPYGVFFEKISIDDFKKRFACFLLNRRNLFDEKNINFNFELELSFTELYLQNIFSHRVNELGYIIALIDFNEHDLIVNNKRQIDFSAMSEVQINFDRIKKRIIDCLIMTSNDYILNTLSIRVCEKENHCLGTSVHPGYVYRPASRTIAEDDYSNFKYALNNFDRDNFKFKIGFQNYLNAQSIDDRSTRFVMYVTVLESMFNSTSSQISHTISRHASLILSIDKDEFENNYRMVKKLYDRRSKLVHGDHADVNEDDIYQVKNVSRKCLLYCLKSNLNKKDLFLTLNKKGFD
jgi:hypothetical protein